MRLSRRTRRLVSGWLIVTLLFMQFATAVYACPAAGRAAGPAQAGPAQAVPAMVHMPGCPGQMSPTGQPGGAMDPDQPQLCKAHCQQNAQTPSATPVADAPALPLLLATLDWARVALSIDAPAASAGQPPGLSSGAPPPGSPPLFLSLLVLRS